MDRLTIPDEPIEGGMRRAVVDAMAVKEQAMGIYWRLKAYEDTGLEPEDINNLIELLRDRCWACDNGKPYRIGSKSLTTCEHLNCVAATSNSGCTFWKLKHFDSSQN